MTPQRREPIVQQLDIIRARRGLTLSAWAELAGMSRQTVYRGMDSDSKVTAARVCDLAAALGLELTVRPDTREGTSA